MLRLLLKQWKNRQLPLLRQPGSRGSLIFEKTFLTWVRKKCLQHQYQYLISWSHRDYAYVSLTNGEGSLRGANTKRFWPSIPRLLHFLQGQPLLDWHKQAFPLQHPSKLQMRFVSWEWPCTEFSDLVSRAEHILQVRQVCFLEAEHKKWVFMKCEPSIWLVLVVSKSWAGPGCSNEGLQSSAAALYSLSLLLHGPINCLLDQVDRNRWGWFFLAPSIPTAYLF